MYISIYLIRGSKNKVDDHQSTRSAIVGDLLSQAGMESLDDVSKETFRMERDSIDHETD